MKHNSLPSLLSNLKWLIPGMRVKRWLALLAFGVALAGLGVVFIVVVLHREGILPSEAYRLLTLQFLSPWERIAVAGLVSTSAIAIAIHQLSKVALAPFLQTGGIPLAEAVYKQRRRDQGPRIVAIGGGTGLSVLLRGLKRHTSNIVAIITVADDGGSSGRLRRELGLPPPGDFRNCITALSSDEALTTRLLQYRFGLSVKGTPTSNGELSGHSFGNLFIAAMTGITGSFEKGLEESSQVLAIQGRILPSTLADVTLVAHVREQPGGAGQELPTTPARKARRVAGESRIPKANGAIEQVYLMPEHPPAYPAAVRAILTADLVVLGPGSLYTSVLPNLLVEGICQALRATRAPVIYVCNVANQPGETDGFEANDYVTALERHTGPGIIDYVVAHEGPPPEADSGDTQYVRLNPVEHVELITRDLIDKEHPWRHDSRKLAKAILSIA